MSIDIEKAKEAFYANTHPHIVWGVTDSTFSQIHAWGYEGVAYCGATIAYLPGNYQDIPKCPDCVRILEENEIVDEWA